MFYLFYKITSVLWQKYRFVCVHLCTSVIQLTPLPAFSGRLLEEPKLHLLSLTIYIYKFYRHYFPNYYPILTHPVNFPCGRKSENPEKTHDFRQSVDELLPRAINIYHETH